MAGKGGGGGGKVHRYADFFPFSFFAHCMNNKHECSRQFSIGKLLKKKLLNLFFFYTVTQLPFFHSGRETVIQHFVYV